ncbi:MAG TPA: DUF3040 domain-containing protein [Micromonosporaceae bacterium]|jgi:hypothetical protein|nr:DUF3040 domain-containing protein [Micromonosporaceae bacterium]
MLSQFEQRTLGDIERWLAADYPDMPRLMARSRWGVGWRAAVLRVLVLAWLVGVVVTATTPAWPAAVLFGSVSAAAVFVVVTRVRRARV